MNTNNGKQPQPAPFDTWAVLDFCLRRWRRLACCTAIFGVAGACVAWAVWGRSFASTAQLIHYEPSAIDDTFRPRALATPSLVVMLQSPGLLEEVGSHLQPPVSAKELATHLEITLDRNNDVATVTATGPSAEATADLVKRFCDAAIGYTQTMQRQEAIEAGDRVNHQLAQVETEISTELAAIPAASVATVAAFASVRDNTAPVASDLPQRIQTARDQLDDLLVRYTDVHPLVREQRARLAALEEAERRTASAAADIPPAGSRPAAPTAMSPAFYERITPEEVAMGERFRSLETTRAMLIGRQQAIQPFRENPPGYFRVLLSVSANPTVQHNHRLEIVLFACLGAFFGLIGSAGQVLLGEFLDNRIKTRADVRRVTGLPLLATLGDLKQLPPADRDQWAFRAWTALQSRLCTSPNRGMVCGVTSAHRGDGRSTWIDLLAGAASNCGFRTLTITARSSPEIAAGPVGRAQALGPAKPPAEVSDSVAMTTSVLSLPGRIAEQLSGMDGQPRIDIPLPGWVWSLERRKQWQTALEAWRAIERIVIFIELPPASVAEAVLLAENIPNLLWLVDSSRSDAAETQDDLETLRDARCNIVGAVLNRERSAPVRNRFSRWLGSGAAILLIGFLCLAPKAPAQESFSVVGPAQRADWQQRLTLGPGDVLSFHLFGSPELTREEVPVGPDGCVSYLEAENIPAAGMTVDELRERLNNELGKYRRSPQAFVTPVAYRSKRYYMLGTVVQKGIFPLDRPITIIEAVARSRGFETGASRGDTIDTTDFSHSFLERGSKRMPVNFERLFLHGDLSQNVALEPGDYLYFPAVASGEIYVLGEVRTPGPAPWDADQNALSAIASRGGFTERAWKRHVLVVRGALDNPEAFTVDVAGVFDGQAPNLALQPGDLVYVSSRPWIKAEELLDRAAAAFVESAVVSWTGINVGPDIIRRPSISP
jgi:protein involved in polysaccharide export with SLBB domain/capsular polysaccharide biosynthesis protein